MTWTHPAVAAHTALLTDVRAHLDRAGGDRETGCVCPGDTDHWFDRSVCPDPCGSMHDVCTECGQVKGHCPVADTAEVVRTRTHAAAAAVLQAHTPHPGPGGAAHCGTCRTPGVDAAVAWPCPAYTLVATVLDATT